METQGELCRAGGQRARTFKTSPEHRPHDLIDLLLPPSEQFQNQHLGPGREGWEYHLKGRKNEGMAKGLLTTGGYDAD